MKPARDLHKRPRIAAFQALESGGLYVLAGGSLWWREAPGARWDRVDGPEILRGTDLPPKSGPALECCPDCDGVGWTEGGKALKTGCPRCKGTGAVGRNRPRR